MATAKRDERPKRVFVFDTPRCCTHLFRKLFSAHPQLTQIDVPFFPPWRGPESITKFLEPKPNTQDPQDANAANQYRTSTLQGMTYAEARTRLMDAVFAAERGEALDSPFGLPSLTTDKQLGGKGNVVFIQDHAAFTIRHDIILDVLRNASSPYNQPGSSGLSRNENPTQLPDELARSVMPVLLIRNPIRAVYSMYKVQLPWVKCGPTDELMKILTSQAWARILFDWFREQGREVLVIDAEDVITDTDGVTGDLCRRMGVSPSGVQQTWRALPPEEQPSDGQMRDYMKEIWGSNGIVRQGKTRSESPNLEVEMAKWEAEFGGEVARGLRERVEIELVNYEYLKSHGSLR